MKLLVVTTVFSVFFQFGKSEIPQCPPTNITNLCALEKNIDEPPKPWPVKIDVVIVFGDLIHVDEKMNSVKVLLQIMQFWNDTRITARSNKTFHQLNFETLNDIWYNEPFFYNTIKVEKFQRIISDRSAYV